MLQARFPIKDEFGLERRDYAEEAHSTAHLSQFISALRRQALLVLGFCLAGLLMGGAYLAVAKPRYTASANIMIDNRQLRAVRDVSAFSDSPGGLDAPELESQVEVLRSPKIGLAVIKSLKLTEDEAFMHPPRGPIGTLLGGILNAFGGKSDEPAKLAQTAETSGSLDHLQMEALGLLERGLKISRVGRTYLLQVDYTASGPARAAEITNAYIDAYMTEQLSSRINATRRARTWLQQRTEELRREAVDTDRMAQKYRAENNLFAVGGGVGTAAKGALISEQQLVETSTQLITYRAAASEAQARYLRIKHIIDNHETDAAVAESLSNTVIGNLRTQYLEAARRYKNLARTLPEGHLALINLKHTMDEVSQLLFEELERVEQSYRNDYEVAVAREKAAVESMAGQQKVTAKANDAQVQLTQLEQKAEAYRTLYNTYLQRYQESVQQESFPMADGHVVNDATVPLDPSEPRVFLVLAFTMAAGTMAGVAGGVYREVMDRVFRTVEQVRSDLGVEVLGMLPFVPSASLSQAASGGGSPIMRYVVDDPFSAFAETLRSAKVSADHALPDRAPKVIGMVSLLPKEGKTTVSKNFASQIAVQGAKTLLIDADTRNPALTREIGLDRRAVPLGDTSMLPPLGELLQHEPISGLDILPCIFAKNDPRIANGFTAKILHSLLSSSDQAYDYVVLDLPPIGPVVNARGMAPAIDAFIFVVAWGSTSRGAVRSALSRERAIRDKLLGVIMNKVNMNKVHIYQHFDSDGYYYKRYDKYYKNSG
jgi:polysaccharide biosynthesis transport protein